MLDVHSTQPRTLIAIYPTRKKIKSSLGPSLPSGNEFVVAYLFVYQVVMSICWKGNDDQFAVLYSNGVIQTYTAKTKANGGKLREKLSVHSRLPQSLPSSQGRVRFLYLNQSPCLVSSENVAKNQLASAQHSLVLYRKTKGMVNPMLLSYSDPVIDFFPITQFPYAQAGT